MKRMNWFHGILLCLLSTFLYGQAEGVQAIINLSPPYSPYFNNYTSLMDNQVVTVRNFTNNTVEVKLAGSITSNVGISAYTSESYLPASIIVLAPGESRVFMGMDQNLEYLDQANAVVDGPPELLNNLWQFGILPEGDYIVCIRVLDYYTNEQYSSDRFSCVSVPIKYLTAPQLIMPTCNDTLFSSPEFISFSWTPPSGNLFGTQIVYDLYAVDVQDGMNPMDALLAAIEFGAGENVYFWQDLMTNVYVRQPFDLEFLPGKTYAWAVVARDANEINVIENGGLSEICVFHIRPELVEEEDIIVEDEDGYTTDGDDPYDATISSISGSLKFRFKDTTGKPFISGTEPHIPSVGLMQFVGNYNDIYAPVAQSQPEAQKVYFPQALSPSGSDLPLGNKTIHIEQVYMSSYVQNPTKPSDYYVIDDIVGSDLGYLELYGSFNEELLAHFRENDPILQLCSGGCPIQYFYYPNMKTVLGTTKTDANGLFQIDFQQLLTMGRIYTGPVDIAPYECCDDKMVDDSGWLKDKIFGQHFGGWRINPADQFSNPANILNNPAITNYSHVNITSAMLGMGGGGNQLMGGTLNPFEGNNPISGQVQTIMAPYSGSGGQPEGMMTFSYPAGQKHQYQMGSDVTGNWKLDEVPFWGNYYGQNPTLDYPKMAVSGYHIYRAIRIRVSDPQFCSPDVIIILKPGEEVALLPETVLANSYNLSVEVKGKDGNFQEEGLANAFVHIGRIVQDQTSVQHKIPGNELKRMNYGQIESNYDESMQYIVMEKGFTNGNGKYTFSRMVRHQVPQISDNYYLQCGSLLSGEHSYQPFGQRLQPHKFTKSGQSLLYNYDTTAYLTRRIFNHQMEVHQLDYTIDLFANDPEVYGQFVTSAGISEGPIAGVVVFLYGGNGALERWQVTDESGIFHFKDLPPNVNRTIQVFKNGFVSPNLPHPGILSEGERTDYGIVNLVPNGHAKGEVVDEHGAPAMAEIKIGDGPYFLTKMLPHTGGAHASTMNNINTNPPGMVHTPANIPQPPGPNNPQFNGSTNIQMVNFSMNSTSAGNNQSLIQSGNVGVSAIGGNPGSIGQTTKINEVWINQNHIGMNTWKSIFNVPAQSGNNIKVIVHPMSDKYFSDTLLFNIPASSSQQNPFNMGTLVVKEKLHRPSIFVYQKSNYNFPAELGSNANKIPVKDAEILIGNQAMVKTNTQGKADLTFASPSNEFRIRIQVPGLNHVPIDEYIVIPISKDKVFFEFEIKSGKVISGVVTDKSTGIGIPQARVFVAVDNHDYGEVIVETFTDDAGNYMLSGVPTTGYMQIHAVRSGGAGTPGYIGVTKWLNPGVQDNVNFELTPLPWALTDIWGFPVEVTKLSGDINSGDISINGYLEIPYGNDRFHPEDDQKKVRFKDLPVQFNEQVQQATPKFLTFELQEQKIRLVLNDQFSCDAHTTQQTKLKVRKDPALQTGKIYGPIKSSLEYFNFSYNYTGAFNLHTNTNTNIDFAFALPNAPMPERYHLGKLLNVGNVGGLINPKFWVHEFPAFADRNESFVEGDTFFLKTILEVTLPLMNQEKLRIPTDFIKVSYNDINVLTEGSSLEFKLEQWTINTGPWKYNKDLGGLRVQSATIITESINVVGLDLTIKPDRLVMNNAASVNWNSFQIGNIAPLHPVHPTDCKLSFSFVEVCHHDQKAHWQMRIFNEGDPYGKAVYIHLPILHNNQKVYYKRIYQYSDNYVDNALDDDQEVSYFGHLTQRVDRVISGNDFFYVSGSTDLGIPGYEERMSSFMWSKNESQQVSLRPYNMIVNIEAYGQVTFVGDTSHSKTILSPQQFSILGTIHIKDDISSNDIALESRFVKRGSQAEIVIIRLGEDEVNGTKQPIGPTNEGHQRILQGKMSVGGNQWQRLKYLAELTNFDNLQPGNEKVWMEVLGSIRNDASQSTDLAVSDIDMGFGTFNIIFDFNTKMLLGTLSIEFPLFLGGATINEGTVQFCVGPLGFYMLAQVVGLYPVIGDLNTNFILGAYHPLPSQAQSLLKENMYMKNLPGPLNNGFGGFYLAANKTIIDFSFEIDLGLLAAGIYANVGADVRFLANYNNTGLVVNLAALGYAEFEAYARVLVCTFCASVLGELMLEATLTVSEGAPLGKDAGGGKSGSASFSAEGCASIEVSLSFCGVADLTESVKAIIEFSNKNGISADVTLGGNCSGNPKVLNDDSSGCKYF